MASVFGLATVVVFRDSPRGMVAGVAVVVAFAALTATQRLPRRSTGRATVRTGALVLPRRRSYAPLVIVSQASIGLGLTLIALLDRDEVGSSGYYRGDPEALIVAAPVMAALVAVMVVGLLTGRGTMHLGVEGLSWVSPLARTRSIGWGPGADVTLIDRDRSLEVHSGDRRLRVPTHTQRWTPAHLESVVGRFAATDAAGRQRLIATDETRHPADART